ncbi:MAG: DUF433 domain-containing protein, partial [Dolichospermum sp.]
APHISVDSGIHHGTPVITETRVPISIIIGSLAGGMSKEEVMQEYELSKTQVEAALSYAGAGVFPHYQLPNYPITNYQLPITNDH